MQTHLGTVRIFLLYYLLPVAPFLRARVMTDSRGCLLDANALRHDVLYRGRLPHERPRFLKIRPSGALHPAQQG